MPGYGFRGRLCWLQEGDMEHWVDFYIRQEVQLISS
jgi:hypothetical protein